MDRLTELDGVRALAALAIVVFHLDNRLLPQGWLAVDLFMLLSGFLITSIVLKHGHADRFLLHFYARRGLRTWPIYYLAVGAVFAAAALRGQPVLGSLPYYLTFTQNVPYYWSNAVPPFPWHFVHTWSLAVEEQYYLVWPALILLLGRRAILPASAVLIVACAFAREAGAHWTLLITRCDGFAFGSMLSIMFGDQRLLMERRRRYVALFWVMGAVALTGAVCLWGDAVGPVPPPGIKACWMLAVNGSFFAGLGLVIVLAGHPLLAPLRAPRLCALGLISYGLYLYHPLLFITVDHAAAALGVSQPILLGIAKLGATFGFAALSWRFVERPLLRLKERFPYRVAAAQAELGVVVATEGDRSAASARPWVTNPV